ncbi:predicted protein [Sclerotinia sclerotiorum 1980 UF-70]|uniref:Uncharacterized protein n=1 Tax=Sclerotinia sclerotiorum (strain ATCC 18683 / 1980 / Ss-1) TaxID=665079 RepID=A7E6V4_SCLS1|nr:predicted protein [Sclerotinia sclerotiorum 1980 UF-70]EDN91626.1 predicted protein [Sclerotinia sclerotiorum 1980 UF-70]
MAKELCTLSIGGIKCKVSRSIIDRLTFLWRSTCIM